MPKDGSQTRERILDAANTLFLQRGITASSIDRIAKSSGLTKGSFFYHFKDKDELILALVERFAEMDRQQYTQALEKVERLSTSQDALQKLLLFVGVFVDQFSGLDEPPACLYAAYLYENGIVSPASMKIVNEAMHFWRDKMSALINAALIEHEMKITVDVASLADMFTATLEGAFLMSQILKDTTITSQQLKHYQTYLSLLFK